MPASRRATPGLEAGCRGSTRRRWREPRGAARSRSAPLLAAASFGALLLSWAPAPAETTPALLAEFRRDPLYFFFDLRTAEAIECGQTLLTGETDFTPSEKKQAFTALAAIYLCTGRHPQARAACLQIIEADPRAELDRPEALPPPVVRLFYGLRDSLLLASGDMGTPDIRTLAVGGIEDNSIVRGKYDLRRFSRGLTHVLISDLQGATPFKIVDRQRLSVLREEIQMSKAADVMDPEYALKLRRLTGAQSFLFGSLMQFDEKKIVLDLQWVDTSTRELLLSDRLEAKLGSSDDLFRLERKLLLEVLVPRMQQWLADNGQAEDLRKAAGRWMEAKKNSIGGGTAYVDLLLKSGEAMLAEERGDLAAARQAWSEVSALRPDDRTADLRARTLGAQVALTTR